MIKQTCAALVIAAVATPALAEKAMNDKEKLSYLLGNNTGKSMLSKEIEIDADTFLQGLKDALGDKKSRLSQAEINDVMTKFQEDMRAKAQQKMEQESAANIKSGKEFIEKYRKQDGVISMDNGITYRIIKKGNGISPTAEDTVVAHYTGKLVDGRVFDSSVERGEPATFPLTGVIRGWQEVVPKMSVGSRWEVVIPPQLAYGERSPGGIIGSNATLVFDIELIEVKPKS